MSGELDPYPYTRHLAEAREGLDRFIAFASRPDGRPLPAALEDVELASRMRVALDGMIAAARRRRIAVAS